MKVAPTLLGPLERARLELFCTRKVPGIHRSDENVERIHMIYVRSPHMLTSCSTLQVPHSTEYRVLEKRLCLYAYKLQVLEAIM
jgi:hypothetical protein